MANASRAAVGALEGREGTEDSSARTGGTTTAPQPTSTASTILPAFTVRATYAAPCRGEKQRTELQAARRAALRAS